jgi:MFS family permease
MQATTCFHDGIPEPVLQEADCILYDPVTFHPSDGVFDAVVAAFSLVVALTSTKGGTLSDTFGRRGLIIAGWLIYALIYLGFAFASAASTLDSTFGFPVITDRFNHMRFVIKALIGNNSSKVGHLQGNNLQLALADRIRINSRKTPPSFSVPLIVKRYGGYIATLFIGKVNT